MTVVVTGAAGGVGRACIVALRAAGAHVVGVDRFDSSYADDHVTLDLASEDSHEVVIRQIGDRPIELLVNNAAFVDYGPAVDIDMATWDRTLAVNLRAPFFLAQALYPNLRAAGGSVVNVSSVHATASSPGVAAYAASKGGMVAMTRSLAIEWAPAVRVNCVLPGAIDTEMLTMGLSRSGISVEELGMRHPMGRVGAPREVAEAVLYLMKAEFTTGATLLVDGGATARLSTE